MPCPCAPFLSVFDAGKFYEVQKCCAITSHVWDGYWINDVALLDRGDLEFLDRTPSGDNP